MDYHMDQGQFMEYGQGMDQGLDQGQGMDQGLNESQGMGKDKEQGKVMHVVGTMGKGNLMMYWKEIVVVIGAHMIKFAWGFPQR